MINFGFWINNYHFWSFFCVVFIILVLLVNIFSIERICSNRMFLLLYFEIYPLLSNNLNQYSVSRVSFEAIDISDIKSLVDCAAWASVILAPIEVPLFKIWPDKLNSFFCYKFLFNCTMFKAKSNDISYISFFIKNYKSIIPGVAPPRRSHSKSLTKA